MVGNNKQNDSWLKIIFNLQIESPSRGSRKIKWEEEEKPTVVYILMKFLNF